MIEGEASLYSYKESDITRFFFENNDSVLEQLVYKKYNFSNTKIGANEHYKQQLWTNFKCDNVPLRTIKNVNYTKRDLLRLFIKYNECRDSKFTIPKNKIKRDVFNLTLRPGFRSNALTIKNEESGVDIDFGQQNSLSFGLEFEFIMPFNKSKWAIVVEPTYQHYESKDISRTINPVNLVIPQTISYNATYKSIEVPIGVRHYFFLNKFSKLYLNGFAVLDFKMEDSNVNFSFSNQTSRPNIIPVKTRLNAAVGLGYKFKNRYSTEIRYLINRNLFVNNTLWRSNYNSLSFVVGYTLF
ncbi:outer membrane beta-barrel protein [Aquimarina sp. U1-2]|uniref:outer membrane beta-barrel protein n=1 Tax=Aquimarina sp. U1-2 TaxID=2823141 RepID=UPI001AECB69A|nr:outer membrane beta-barrel protein [Aquimarina sp. U1-2]MBP2833423.1 outer membrane beta-barrel protein [Aquimarina sp. U1-2]